VGHLQRIFAKMTNARQTPGGGGGGGGGGWGTHGIDCDIKMLYSPICVWAQRIEPSFYYTNNLFTFLFHFTFLQRLIVVT
jgi:hypothetical protein